MSEQELICCNGKLVGWTQTGLDMNHLLSTNFVYQKIHTLEHNPLQLERHIELASHSYLMLYGVDAGLSAPTLRAEIEALLSKNRYPRGSTLVTLYLIPPQSEQNTLSIAPTQIVSCEKQLIYRGYTHWHSALKTAIIPYTYPFPEHQTALSLNAHSYANSVAMGRGMDVAVAKSSEGLLTSVEGYPLFGMERKSIYTSPLDSGVVQSVERQLGLASCRALGLNVVEEPITEQMIAHFEEMFFIDPQGAVSIGSCGGRLFPASMAKNVARELTTIHL